MDGRRRKQNRFPFSHTIASDRGSPATNSRWWPSPSKVALRRAGSAALDLAYVAAGRFDGFWEIGLKPWDMAAGAVLVEEAGGLVSDFSGNPLFMESGNLLCANVKIYKEMLKALHPHLASGDR